MQIDNHQLCIACSITAVMEQAIKPYLKKKYVHAYRFIRLKRTSGTHWVVWSRFPHGNRIATALLCTVTEWQKLH